VNAFWASKSAAGSASPQAPTGAGGGRGSKVRIAS
jgi:hypothetical protein